MKFIHFCTAPALPEKELYEKMQPEFNPDKRLKDPAKIEEDLARKKSEWYDNCATSGITGKIELAFIADINNYKKSKRTDVFPGKIYEDEIQGMEHICLMLNSEKCCSFSLWWAAPFFVQRSMVLKRRDMARSMLECVNNNQIIDLTKVWDVFGHARSKIEDIVLAASESRLENHPSEIWKIEDKDERIKVFQKQCEACLKAAVAIIEIV